MQIYQVWSKNYKVSEDDMIIGTFSTLEKANAFVVEDLKRVKAEGIKQIDDTLYTYTSHYGSYPCCRQIKTITVQ